MSNSFFVCYAREDYEYVASFKLELDNQLKIKSENLCNISLKKILEQPQLVLELYEIHKLMLLVIVFQYLLRETVDQKIPF